MQALILTIHIIACVALITLVLLQSGKEGMGVIFGGGSDTMFGGTGAGSFLSRLTAWVGAIFLMTSLGYSVVSMERTDSGSRILDVDVQAPAPEREAPQGVTIEDAPAAADEAQAPAQADGAADDAAQAPAPKQGATPESAPEGAPESAPADEAAPGSDGQGSAQ